MKTTFYFLLLAFGLCFSCASDDSTTEPEQTDDELYFPALNSDTWETKSISDLSWNENELQPLLDFLEEKNTKSFIILHNGKIVIEEYFNTHNDSKLWYWASAGKTLTTAV
ncbi:MAG: serine hydrolase, partial [Flavobacteriaceae bacterium]